MSFCLKNNVYINIFTNKNKMRCVIDQDGLILKLKGSIHEVSEFHKQQIDGLNKECAKQKVLVVLV